MNVVAVFSNRALQSQLLLSEPESKRRVFNCLGKTLTYTLMSVCDLHKPTRPSVRSLAFCIFCLHDSHQVALTMKFDKMIHNMQTKSVLQANVSSHLHSPVIRRRFFLIFGRICDGRLKGTGSAKRKRSDQRYKKQKINGHASQLKICLTQNTATFVHRAARINTK